MGFIDGDLVPSSSGTSHLGVDARGATNFDISSLSPFGHIHQLSGVFHSEVGTSGIFRFGNTNMEFSVDGGKTFTTFKTAAIPNGQNGDVFFFDNVADGSLGTDHEGLNYNATTKVLGLSGTMAFSNRNPLDVTNAGPKMASGITEIYGTSLAERPIIAVETSGQYLGLPYFMQPALFNKLVAIITCGATTNLTAYGCFPTSVGTISHPTANVASGQMVNHVTAGSANSTAGTSTSLLPFVRAGMSGVNTGFFFAARMTLPDANLDAGRVFVGLIAGSLASSVGANDPGNNHCGFSFSTTQANPKNWHFSTKDATAQSRQDTGISCSGNRIWDMYIYSPPFPNNDVIYWTLHDVSWNRIQSGYAINNLPVKNTFMRAGIQLSNITASARNIRYTTIYCESLC